MNTYISYNSKKKKKNQFSGTCSDYNHKTKQSENIYSDSSNKNVELTERKQFASTSCTNKNNTNENILNYIRDLIAQTVIRCQSKTKQKHYLRLHVTSIAVILRLP